MRLWSFTEKEVTLLLLEDCVLLPERTRRSCCLL
ncbi:hypothetical protein NC652_006980 [Populus alba x Populus x berolinensis]|nr:hypothetical protein NC652_006980 [Populus alba x Populus x berolinensis]